MLLNHHLCCSFQSCRQRISAQTNYILRVNDKILEHYLNAEETTHHPHLFSSVLPVIYLSKENLIPIAQCPCDRL